MPWRSAEAPEPHHEAYTCGYCGNKGGPREVIYGTSGGGRDGREILVCAVCDKPSALIDDELTPGPKFGESVGGLPADVAALCDEARGSMAVPAHTAAVLLCRKILMHVAVGAGAGENLKFIEYVQYLSDKHYVPPNAKGWVDHIRDKGNEANHEIVLMSREEAQQLISFTEILLKLMYELPNQLPGATAP